MYIPLSHELLAVEVGHSLLSILQNRAQEARVSVCLELPRCSLSAHLELLKLKEGKSSHQPDLEDCSGIAEVTLCRLQSVLAQLETSARLDEPSSLRVASGATRPM